VGVVVDLNSPAVGNGEDIVIKRISQTFINMLSEILRVKNVQV
jgi:hypothetical protein